MQPTIAIDDSTSIDFIGKNTGSITTHFGKYMSMDMRGEAGRLTPALATKLGELCGGEIRLNEVSRS